jgi:hypothetical protein
MADNILDGANLESLLSSSSRQARRSQIQIGLLKTVIYSYGSSGQQISTLQAAP